MKIRDLFKTGKRVFSFEFFPPKTEAGAANLERTIRELADLQPSFVSVTYGAGGSARDRTVELVKKIQQADGICAMAHLTCVGSGRDEIAGVVDRLVDAGIENLIALRGDPPAGAERFEVPADGFGHASDLVTYLRQRYGDRLCVAGAAYPEGHPERAVSPDIRDLDEDMRHL